MRRDQADSDLLILLRANRSTLRSNTNPTTTPPVPMVVQSRMALRASYRQSGMYGPPPYCKRKMRKTEIGLRECIRPLLDSRSPGLNGMRCALVLFNNAAFVGIFRMQVSGAPGSTVVPSHGSPANLAGSENLDSSSLACRCGNRCSDFQA